MLLMLMQLKFLSNPFRVKLLFLLFEVEEEIAVVESVVSGCVCLCVILEMDHLTWFYDILIARDV